MLVRTYRSIGKRVAVLAVDPSSPFSGGALLGDRVRMQDHATDRDVFIRSMASRGHLGGLSAAAPQAIRVLARAQQDAVWDQQQTANKLRSLLRQYFPTFLATFPDLTTMGARSTRSASRQSSGRSSS